MDWSVDVNATAEEHFERKYVHAKRRVFSVLRNVTQTKVDLYIWNKPYFLFSSPFHLVFVNKKTLEFCLVQFRDWLRLISSKTYIFIERTCYFQYMNIQISAMKNFEWINNTILLNIISYNSFSWCFFRQIGKQEKDSVSWEEW